MHLFFVDDSKQGTPAVADMGPLVAIGGIAVPSANVRPLENALGLLCTEFSFPPGEKFKWSPGRELWMRDNLIGNQRYQFQIRALALAHEYDAKAIVVIEDTRYRSASGRIDDHEENAVRLFLERVELFCRSNRTEAIVVADRPGGDRADEERFLLRCVETIESGTEYVKPECFALNVLASNSRFVRLLQLADLITACTVARVGGEVVYSPRVFDSTKVLFISETGRIGGVGLKIHPHCRYLNLYHWLVQDEYHIRFNAGWELPILDLPFDVCPYIPPDR